MIINELQNVSQNFGGQTGLTFELMKKSIKYFPLTELIFFLIVTVLTFVVSDYYNLSVLIPLLLTFVSYFIFLGGTNLIRVTEDRIQITFLNIIGGQTSIELKKITKIWTTETYEQEETIDMESGYYFFRRSYNIEYLDNRDKERLVNFRVSSRKKEIEIIGRISKLKETKI